MKYNTSNPPIQCMMTQSTCYKGTTKMTVKGVLWHSTGANNPNLKRYVQPDDAAPDRAALLSKLGVNTNKNDWNHISKQAGLNAWVGKLADGSVAAVQTMPWDFRPWGCGSGSKGSCNSGWVQFEICEDALTDADYFAAAYKEACELTAYLCTLYGIDPNGTADCSGVTVPTILCHADSYKLKLGSNHADVLHWFPKFGKSMETVRADVAALMSAASAPSTEGKTPIMGKAEATAGQMATFCLSKNAEPKLPSCTVEELARLFIEEGEAEGVRGDVAFAQSLHETGYFKFGGIVLPEQNNYGGLGALNGNSAGQAASFPDPRSGVRAQIQHLKAYASKDALVNECIDPRFSLVLRGCSEFVEWLGASDNPNGRGWAVPGAGYGGKIVALLEQIKATKAEEPEPEPEPESDGYPENTPAWQKEGFEALVERGIINSPEYWKARFDKTMTAGEILGILGRI